MEIVEGLHVPVIELVDVVDKVAGVAPWQYGPIAAKVGVTGALTVTLRVALLAHWPASGVNVKLYVPAMAVEIVDGVHDPEIPSVELEGRLVASPSQ